MDKRGIANVVAVGLLILIGIIAIGILWFYIYNSLNPGFSPAFSCFDMQLNPSILITKACYNDDTGDFEIGVRRDKDKLNIKSLYLVFNSENESKTYCCGEGCESCDVLEEGSDKNYYISGNGNEKSIVLRIFNCGIGQKDIVKC